MTFLTLFSTHTHSRAGNLASALLSLRARRTLCAGREEDFDVINIRFQLFHCELSSRVAALTDFLLLMQSHSSLPPRPFPLSLLYLLSAHYTSFILSASPSLRSSTLFPNFFSPPPPPSTHFPSPPFVSPPPVIIISVIALPLPGGDVFTAASLSNSLMLDYCCMITATIP